MRMNCFSGTPASPLGLSSNVASASSLSSSRKALNPSRNVAPYADVCSGGQQNLRSQQNLRICACFQQSMRIHACASQATGHYISARVEVLSVFMSALGKRARRGSSRGARHHVARQPVGTECTASAWCTASDGPRSGSPLCGTTHSFTTHVRQCTGIARPTRALLHASMCAVHLIAGASLPAAAHHPGPTQTLAPLCCHICKQERLSVA